jgi:hypothetical protein
MLLLEEGEVLLLDDGEVLLLDEGDVLLLDEGDVLLLELLGEVALEELGDVVLLCVVSVLGDFLSLFLSPSASAEVLAIATIDVRMNAGASLRIWASLG